MHSACREVEILKNLSKRKHNVFTTKLIDIALVETNLFLVMDYMQNDLRRLLDSLAEGKLTIKEDHVVTIIYNILSAINYLHGSNLIHRDIKPCNILISSDCEIKICDFGLARSLSDKITQKVNFYHTVK